MTTFALISAIISAVILFGFIGVGVRKFGLLPSYSAYVTKWDEAVPLETDTHLWSVVTIIAAALVLPLMLERGEGNFLQCLGFFVPLYLCVVAFTPHWQTDKKQHVIHFIGASLCALVNIAWICLVMRLWWVMLIALAVFGAAAYFTKTWKSSTVFWLEMIMFSSAYAAALL